MRVLGLALVGVIAAATQTAALADQQAKIGAAGRSRSTVQVTIADSRAHPAPGAPRQGWQPHWQYGGRGPYAAWGAPAYWVWVPGSAVFDYPFADWREPTGGWGNP